ncbi:hypothetical protein LCGC14_1092240 [marine sediment metagenome]|uniref:Uncharacterized protein n=1 Tax=marine sediment metagenome TaxID=412755 RepID=A0A0F9PV62_9ZZZZ
MKKEVTQNKWFCDVCEREGSYNGKCELCEKEFCYVCEFIGFNPTHIMICKDHQKDDKMKDCIRSFEEKWRKLKSDMKEELIRKLNERGTN